MNYKCLIMILPIFCYASDIKFKYDDDMVGLAEMYTSSNDDALDSFFNYFVHSDEDLNLNIDVMCVVVDDEDDLFYELATLLLRMNKGIFRSHLLNVDVSANDHYPISLNFEKKLDGSSVGLVNIKFCEKK